jgi:hypothetical protein
MTVATPVPPEWLGFSHGWGAGIYVNGGSPQITDCLIASNSIVTTSYVGGGGGSASANGAGLCLIDSGALISRCTITGNVARAGANGGSSSNGAGIFVSGTGRPQFIGCSVVSNSAETAQSGSTSCGVSGAGVALYSAVDVVNCRIVENMSSGCGSPVAGIQFLAIGSTMSGTRICGNIGTQTSGAYANFGGNSISSACAGCAGDLNNDGKVDGADLGLLLTNWGLCP